MAKVNLDRIFVYHRPFGTQPQRYEAIREFARAFAKLITDSTPPSAEQTLAIRNLQQAVMFANAAIAINEVEPEPASVPDATGVSEETTGAAVV